MGGGTRKNEGGIVGKGEGHNEQHLIKKLKEEYFIKNIYAYCKEPRVFIQQEKY